MFEVIPAIDIMDGRCVRLTQGDYGTQRRYDSSPRDMALRYADCGFTRLHLVDLDGAKAGRPENLRTLEDVANAVDGLTLEWGGGLKTGGDLKSAFSAGMTDAVIGSVAVKEPEKMSQWLAEYGPDHVVLGADARDGMVAVAGWQETSAVSLDEVVAKYAAQGLTQAIVTDIARDGMLHGPSFDLYTALQSKFPGVIFTVSGGISGIADVEEAARLGLKRVIVGKAIYEGLIDLKQLSKLNACLQNG